MDCENTYDSVSIRKAFQWICGDIASPSHPRILPSNRVNSLSYRDAISGSVGGGNYAPEVPCFFFFSVFS